MSIAAILSQFRSPEMTVPTPPPQQYQEPPIRLHGKIYMPDHPLYRFVKQITLEKYGMRK